MEEKVSLSTALVNWLFISDNLFLRQHNSKGCSVGTALERILIIFLRAPPTRIIIRFSAWWNWVSFFRIRSLVRNRHYLWRKKNVPSATKFVAAQSLSKLHSGLWWGGKVDEIVFVSNIFVDATNFSFLVKAIQALKHPDHSQCGNEREREIV